MHHATTAWLRWIGLRLLGGAVAGLALSAAVHLYAYLLF